MFQSSHFMFLVKTKNSPVKHLNSTTILVGLASEKYAHAQSLQNGLELCSRLTVCFRNNDA